ncbi:MAG TPA: P-II family nitrogen regulator [Candidatus Binataceae bacterium]|nr:P-II family nitrogen regulator [Candidatus Binataceae bacterium]
MKKVEAILTPHRLDAVRQLLLERGCQEIIVSDVRNSEGPSMRYRGIEYPGDAARVKIEAVLADAEAIPAARAILHSSPERLAEDERVSVCPLDDVISIGIWQIDSKEPEFPKPLDVRGHGAQASNPMSLSRDIH